MNEDLRKSKVKKYLTYIQMMYEGIKIKSFTTNNSKMLYRGTYFSFEEIKTLLNYISNKKEGLPAALVSCKSFLSFSLNKNVAQSYLKSKKNLITVLLIIDNNNDYSIIHSGSAAIKQFSFYSNEEEILFFPFSCFEIKKIEKSYNNLCIITLNHLRKYEKIFKKTPKELADSILEYSNTAKEIYKSEIIRETYYPEWGRKFLNNIENEYSFLLILKMK